ncbi:MAG: hypothetical protein J0I21_10355 [Alphaproteobacteria bacterium]|nr:hypothetical protein [Alphaproteobacteria bacterium]
MPEPDPAQTGRSPATPSDAARKAELEAALAAAPADRARRSAYYEHLFRLAATHAGLATVVLPELMAPLYFRTGTPDISMLAAVYRDESLAIEMRATPQRILVIGAYAGYTTVDLARRHPRAALLAVEPLADNFRLLSANTTPYRHVRVAQTALWHSATRLAANGRYQADWAVRLTDEGPDSERVISAMAPGDLLMRAGWSGTADMVVCDAAGAEREIFADPLAPWLRNLDVALVRVHEQLAAGAGAAVSACFDEATFERRSHAGMELFLRRTPLTALPPAPPEWPLLRAEPGLAPFSLRDVAPYAWAFFVFDGTNCQLHPNPPGGVPARAIFPVLLAGHTRFASGLHHAGAPPAAPVLFGASVQREDGSVLARAEATLTSRETGMLAFALPDGASGPARVVLQTEMASGVPHNQLAWARFIEPKLT